MKKAQQRGTAASLVATITGLIILYIIFLPAEDRAELLGESPPRSSAPGTIHAQPSHIENKTIFRTSPGRILYQKLDEFEYDLPAFTLLKITEATVIDTINNFRIRNGWFDKIRKNVTFGVPDLENTDNLLLSFNTPRHRGTLTIRLNGIEIYQFDINTQSPNPVSLKKSLLSRQNVLEFSVSGVGLKLWLTNEYSFSDMKISADLTDTSRQESRNAFYISPEEGDNLEKAVLKFNPECNPRDVGILEVNLNGRNVFTGVPDCGILNTYAVSPSLLNVGKNSVTFKTERGSYLVDRIQAKTFLREPVQPTFFFDLDEDLFKNVEEKEERCGDIDDVCPDDCSEDLDRDCCFEEFPEGYWCDVRTEFIGDRCVGFVDKDQCDRCHAGYEDEDQDPPEECENICGDDTDDECPHDCRPKYDKDCCFELHGDQFWCDDLPITGEDFTCMNELSRTTCQNCQTEYEAEEDDVDCDFAREEGEEELKSGIDIILIFRFTESREEKEAEVWINGQQTSFVTRESSYRKNINDFVEPDTNSIRIRPRTDLDIRELEVKLD